ncbi:MAG: radical SAM protein, partial [Sphaerochaetaceae bacterium]|nr:radical SAM protein [Sphaerochaetaceae bacterium]
CPLRLRRIAGQWWEASDLSKELLRNRTILEKNGGGITFSGGEPLLQYAFMLEVIKNLEGLHCAIETSGFASEDVFKTIVDAVDFVIMDLKVIDDAMHRNYCGQSNKPILRNLEYLKRSGVPFMIRIPMIPQVNDSEENLIATADLLGQAEHLVKVELLPYQKTAGAKYEMISEEYRPRFDVKREPNVYTHIFIDRNIVCSVG